MFDYSVVSHALRKLQTAYALKVNAPHALLLLSQPGIPGKEIASWLVASLLCRETSSAPCGTCDSCVRAEHQSHPNLLMLSLGPKERSLKIEQLRRLLGRLSLNPLGQGLRVIFIPEAEAMTIQAQNALLKSLEEALEGDHYILCTNNERSILPTIMSRCQVQRLLPWTPKLTAGYMEYHGLSSAEAETWSLASKGFPENALAMARDKQRMKLRALVDSTFLSLRSYSDIPAASALLKELREEQGSLLDILEQETLQALFPPDNAGVQPAWKDCSELSIKAVLEEVFRARQYRASNVSWQAIADRILFTIAKEIYVCQW